MKPAASLVRRFAAVAAVGLLASVVLCAGETPAAAPTTPPAPVAAAEAENQRVVILANAGDSESVALAHFYAQLRAIPEANIVALPMSTDETITWDVFVREVFNPLLARLIEARWIDARPGTMTDAAGRTRIAASGHRIAYLVACRGVPLRIAHDPARWNPAAAIRVPQQFRTNQASVDSELALLPAVLPDVNGIAKNPLYFAKTPSPFDLDMVVRVARLDGPTAAACRNLVTSALAAEKNGLAGRAYLDLEGPHPSADAWLRATGRRVRALDFDVAENTDKGVFQQTDRFDAPAFYFGWYANDVTGPFRAPGFRFPPGAIAMHIHSFSARTVRSETEGWAGPLVGLGAAATIGNVFEPFLEFTHRPDLILEALSEGKTLGEAACYALPSLSWQAVLIGDPLYRPLARPLDEQLAALDTRPDGLAAYVALREANRLARTGRAAGVLPWLEKNAAAHPAPALSLRLSGEREKAGDREGAVRELAAFAAGGFWTPPQLALAAEAARRLDGLGAEVAAVGVYRAALEAAGDDDWRRLLLPLARDAAGRAGDAELQRVWTDAWEKLAPPAPAAPAP